MRHVCTEREKEKEKEIEIEIEHLFELKPFVRESKYKKQLLILINKSNL